MGWLVMALLVTTLLYPTPAKARDIPLWGHQIIGQIYNAQFNNGCYASPPKTPSVYLLGVDADDALLSRTEKVRLTSELETVLSSTGNFRFQSAGVIKPIATTTGSNAQAERKALSDLVQSASDADMTLVLRPFERRDDTVSVRVLYWARDGVGPARKLTCTPARTIQYQLVQSDKTCNPAWTRARRADTIGKYQGFLDYLSHCPQADQAQARIRALSEEKNSAALRARCKRALRATRTANTSAAYAAYLTANPDCPNGEIIAARLQELRTSEAREKIARVCRDAFRLARAANTPAALDTFLVQHPTCNEREIATELRDALIVRANADKALRNAERRAQQRPRTQQGRSRRNTQPSCNDLWYARNAIFHRNGYRFSSARGRRAFGTGGHTRNPRLSRSEQREVKRIKRLERANGC
ncbi:MAG: YARHG domain-containing protein [Pseudomonadota bacterium]